MIEVYAEDEALTSQEEAGIRTACETALEMEGAAGDITVLVAGPDHIRQLNRDFRNVDRVTDVLTFPSGEGEALLGYGMAAKSFSTEFGKKCIWIEDLYVAPRYRGRRIGSAFLEFMTRRYPDSILRLEVEEENERAIAVYRKSGFEVLPYMEMKKE